MAAENHNSVKVIINESNEIVTATLKKGTAHLPLLRPVFLRDSRVVSSADSGSRFPVLEFPVHWPAAISRRQLKNDDRCPQNNLTLLHTQRKTILYHLALTTQPWYLKEFCMLLLQCIF